MMEKAVIKTLIGQSVFARIASIFPENMRIAEAFLNGLLRGRNFKESINFLSAIHLDSIAKRDGLLACIADYAFEEKCHEDALLAILEMSIGRRRDDIILCRIGFFLRDQEKLLKLLSLVDSDEIKDEVAKYCLEIFATLGNVPFALETFEILGCDWLNKPASKTETENSDSCS